MALTRALLLLVVPRNGALKAALSAEMTQFRRRAAPFGAARASTHHLYILCVRRYNCVQERRERGGFVTPLQMIVARYCKRFSLWIVSV